MELGSLGSSSLLAWSRKLDRAQNFTSKDVDVVAGEYEPRATKASQRNSGIKTQGTLLGNNPVDGESERVIVADIVKARAILIEPYDVTLESTSRSGRDGPLAIENSLAEGHDRCGVGDQKSDRTNAPSNYLVSLQ